MRVRLVVVVCCISFSSCSAYGDWFGGDLGDQIRIQQILQEIKKLTQKVETLSAQQKTDITIHHHGASDNASVYVVQNSVKQDAQKLDTSVVKSNKINGQAPLPAVRPSWWQRAKNFMWSSRQADNPYQPDDSLWGYLNSHKKEIVVKGALIGYVYVNYRLFSLGSYLQSTDRWHFWRSDKTLSQLLALPPKEVARDLIYEIKRRYVSYDGDSSEPFIQFMKSVDQEIEAFNSYLALANILSKIDMVERHCIYCCGRFIPRQFSPIANFVFDFVASKISIRSVFYLDEQLITCAQDSLSRLVFLRSCFAQWLAEFKLLALNTSEPDSSNLSCSDYGILKQRIRLDMKGS